MGLLVPRKLFLALAGSPLLVPKHLLGPSKTGLVEVPWSERLKRGVVKIGLREVAYGTTVEPC